MASQKEYVVCTDREPCPPGLFLKWLPHKLTLEVHVHPRGCVASYRKYTQTLDVQEIIEECMTFWATVGI